MGKGIKKWTLAIGIAIIFVLFVNYGIATFYEGPDYNDYCKEDLRAMPIQKERTDCQVIEIEDEVREDCEGNIAYEYNATGCPVSAYCNTCWKEFEAVSKPYEGNVFIILIVLGITAIILGLFLKIVSVSTGFLIGGILNVVVGSMRYWQHMHNAARFTLLGFVLVLLMV